MNNSVIHIHEQSADSDISLNYEALSFKTSNIAFMWKEKGGGGEWDRATFVGTGLGVTTTSLDRYVIFCCLIGGAIRTRPVVGEMPPLLPHPTPSGYTPQTSSSLFERY